MYDIANWGTRYGGPPVLLMKIRRSGTVGEQEAFLERLIPLLDRLDVVTHLPWHMVTAGK